MIKNTVLFIITTTLLVTGQALWKIAAAQIREVSGAMNIILKLSTNVSFLTGCIFYVIATGLWIYLLGQYEYSKIYPIFVGTCVIISLIAGIVFFRENTGIFHKALGAVFIVGGIIIITRA